MFSTKILKKLGKFTMYKNYTLHDTRKNIILPVCQKSLNANVLFKEASLQNSSIIVKEKTIYKYMFN